MVAEQQAVIPGFEGCVPRSVSLTEQEKWRHVRGKMEQSEESALALEERRRMARRLVYLNIGMSEHRVMNSVCADDVNAALEIKPLNRHMRDSYKNNLNGAIFAADGWMKLGTIKSRREGGHGNEIKLWTLKEYYTSSKAMFDREYAVKEPSLTQEKK